MPQKRLNYKDAEFGLAGMCFVAGNFTCNGASNPTVFSKGPFAVARTGAGQLTLTLKENVSEILAVVYGVQGATANNDAFVTTSTSIGTAAAGATVVIESQTAAGTAGDLTGIICHFIVVYRKGSLTK